MSLVHETITVQNGFKVGITRSDNTDGTPLVFLHGLSVSAQAYTELLEQLAGQGFNVIALDAADHGNSDSLPWGHDVADMAYVVLRALNKLRVDQVVLVGHSMGGSIAAEFAAHWPSMVHSLILLDAAVGEDHHSAIRFQPNPTVGLRAAQFVSAALGDIAGDAVRAVRVRSRSEMLNLGNTLRRSLSGVSVLRATWALMRHDSGQALQRIREYGVPTAHIHGTRDRIVDVTAALNAGLASGGHIVLIPGAFHSWMLVDPTLGARIIGEAVERAA